MSEPHPLLEILQSAASGSFPAVDGAVTVTPPWHDDLAAVVCFTGHAVVATSRSASDVIAMQPDGFGGALDPAFLLWLAGPSGRCGAIDVTLVGWGQGGGTLPTRRDLEDHHRVRYARRVRRDVRVYGDERGLVTLAKGLAGRTELSIEIESSEQGNGLGRQMIGDALRLVGDGEPVFAAVSPGNARSLRAFLACGFTPIGSEVLITQ